MFDEQIRRILELIDIQLDSLQWRQPGSELVVSFLHTPLPPCLFPLNKKRTERKRERMLMVAGQSYIVLSGGLGSSKYVQTKIEEYYQRRSIPVLFSTDPREPYVPSSPFLSSLMDYTARSPSARA